MPLPALFNTRTFRLNFIVGIICCILSTSYAKPILEHIAYSVLPHTSILSVWIFQTACVTIMYLITYFGFAFAFEYTHPKSAFSGKNDEATKKRMDITKYSIYYSAIAIVICTVYAMSFIRFIEPHLPFYGYWADKDYTIKAFFFELIAYMWIFDTWFYWTHRMLHSRRFLGYNLWKHVHSIHHYIIEPNAFSQDATHPFEALIQGPMGHHMINFFLPIHPVCHALFGFLTSVWAIAAHDSRQYDFNGHAKHHHYCHVNFGIYWGFWDYICGTRYCDGKYQRLKNARQNPFKSNGNKKLN